jgi:cysteinyl-tRNA synthetase
MEKIYLYNTLTRKKEEFKPINDGEVGLYTCGPTVYNFAHIGNLRTYLFEDLLKRTLQYNGYKVKHVMNITDVGHLTGDMDMGEDKMEKGVKNMLYLICKKCGKEFPSGIEMSKEVFEKISRGGQQIHPRCPGCGDNQLREIKDLYYKEDNRISKNDIFEIAEFYTEAFKKDLRELNIIEPNIWCNATDNIPEQIELIKILENKDFTYRTSDGIYFDTSKFKDYNKLSHLDLETLREGARVEKNEEKKNPTDFALWKFSPAGEKRQMEWESPWGIGFPGWHIECSAMSLKFLGDQLDIHCGGIDHINVHHTNEIAQSEAATGHKFFNYWIHGAFLNIVGGKKMAKSADNFLTIDNTFLKNNINPLVYRFAALQTHYRKPMEYGDESIVSAVAGLSALYGKIVDLGKDIGAVNNDFKNKFLEKINDDLNFSEAIAVLHEVLKSELSLADKLATVLDFDSVLGLNFNKIESRDLKFTQDALVVDIETADLVKQRAKARTEKNWAESDRLRDEIEAKGFSVEDTKDGMRIEKK